MKLTLTAFLLSATAALAGPTENITGCATVPVTDSNVTQLADLTCALDENKDGDPLLMQVATAAFIDAITPDEAEAE